MLENLGKRAAEIARDYAEEYFKLNDIETAIKSLIAARDFDRSLPGIDDYYSAYRVHQIAATKGSTLYETLAITTDHPELEATSDSIKKQYKRLALSLHPDKNPSVAAAGAFRIIKSAMEILTDPEKREAYDRRRGCSCCKKPKTTTSTTTSGGGYASSSSSPSRARKHSNGPSASASSGKSKPHEPKYIVVQTLFGNLKIPRNFDDWHASGFGYVNAKPRAHHVHKTCTTQFRKINIQRCC